MYPIFKNLHSVCAYLALALLVIAIANSFLGRSGGKSFLPKDRKIALFALIATHTQFTIGLILYFLSPVGLAGFNMKVSALRLTSLEHPLTNLIAVALITIGWSKHKKAATDEAKFKSIALFYAIGLVLLLSRIPYKAWLVWLS